MPAEETPLSDELLLQYNTRGLLVGPQESEEEFVARCKAFYPITAYALPLLKKVFDVEPDWIEISYSNKGLRFWEGGCAWIGDTLKLQLRKKFAEQKYLWGMYNKEELLAHEMVHLVRCRYQEPRFEEIIAYQTATAKWRRFLGPFFRSEKESLYFIIILSFFIAGAFYFPLHILSSLVLSLWVGGMIVRLLRLQSLFLKALTSLKFVVADPQNILAVMLRLTDQEIQCFARWSKEEIVGYITKEKSLRWRQICLAYFPHL